MQEKNMTLDEVRETLTGIGLIPRMSAVKYVERWYIPGETDWHYALFEIDFSFNQLLTRQRIEYSSLAKRFIPVGYYDHFSAGFKMPAEANEKLTQHGLEILKVAGVDCLKLKRQYEKKKHMEEIATYGEGFEV
jgi:hypothetical protein